MSWDKIELTKGLMTYVYPEKQYRAFDMKN